MILSAALCAIAAILIIVVQTFVPPDTGLQPAAIYPNFVITTIAPRPNHAQALGRLALDMRDAVAKLVDPRGRRGRYRLSLRLNKEFLLESRGVIEVKGKGAMRTWFLVGRKENAPAN